MGGCGGAISFPESLIFLVSEWLLGDSLAYWKMFEFFNWLFTATKLRTVKPTVTIPSKQSLCRYHPLNKKPEDSGHQIVRGEGGGCILGCEKK